MTVQIKDKDVELKYSIRALMLYEKISDESFSGANMTQSILLFYCIVLASADINLSFSEFIDELDKNPFLLSDISEWYSDTVNKQNELVSKHKAKKKIKKSSSQN